MKFFGQLLERPKCYRAGTKKPLAHINHAAIPDGFELVPSGAQLKIVQRNPAVDTLDQQDEVRTPAKYLFQADLGPCLVYIRCG